MLAQVLFPIAATYISLTLLLYWPVNAAALDHCRAQNNVVLVQLNYATRSHKPPKLDQQNCISLSGAHNPLPHWYRAMSSFVPRVFCYYNTQLHWSGEALLTLKTLKNPKVYHFSTSENPVQTEQYAHREQLKQEACFFISFFCLLSFA